MEFLGRTFESPKWNKSKGWKYVELEYDSSDDFNKATGKLVKAMCYPESDGQLAIANHKGEKFLLEVIHTNFDTTNNIIQVLPYSCRQIVD